MEEDLRNEEEFEISNNLPGKEQEIYKQDRPKTSKYIPTIFRPPAKGNPPITPWEVTKDSTKNINFSP